MSQPVSQASQSASQSNSGLMFISESATLQALEADLNGSHLYSQGQAASLLGVSEKSLREWNRDLTWVFYWVADALIHKGQYTRAGLFALADLQLQTRRKVFRLKPQPLEQQDIQPQIDRDALGKARVDSRLPLMTLQQYAASIWQANGINSNPMPYTVGSPTDVATAQVVAQTAYENVERQAAQQSAQQQQGQQQGHLADELDDSISADVIEGEILSLVFTPVESGDLLDITLDEVTDLISTGDNNTSSWVSRQVNQARHDGKLFGTVLAKVTIAELEKAKSEVIEQYESRSTVTDEVQKRTGATKRSTKKV